MSQHTAKKSLANRVEQLWYSSNRGYWLLMPLAWLYGAITALRRWLFRIGLKRQYKLPQPVIVVGNISVGGTGKTPFTLLLCQLLRQQGWQPGIVSRGYGAKVVRPTLVTAASSAKDCGDEPLLLAQRSGCPVVVCPDRVAAAQFLLANTATDIIISDDGLQHYALARDVEIVLIDGKRGLGNGQLLPAGPLRERPWRLQQVDLVLANTQPHNLADGIMQLVADKARPLMGNASLSNNPVTLVAGIGNPERFVDTAEQAGFNIIATRFFADHHKFTAEDFSAISGPVLMTEKDAVKCRDFARPDWFSLAVAAQLDQPGLTKLTTLITELRSRYGT